MLVVTITSNLMKKCVAIMWFSNYFVGTNSCLDHDNQTIIKRLTLENEIVKQNGKVSISL